MTDRQPWERQPDETPRAWHAFTLYRDAGPRRSLRDVAHHLYGSATKVRQVGAWSSRHRWVDRVAAWDEEQDRIRREAAADALRDMAERHARAATALITEGLANLAMLREQRQQTSRPQMSPRDMLAYVDVAARLERLARGEAADTVEHRGDSPFRVILNLPEHKRRPDQDDDDA